MKVKNPDGTERELPVLASLLAQEVLDEAKRHFDEAEIHRAKDWRAYSTAFVRAVRIEEAAVKLDEAVA